VAYGVGTAGWGWVGGHAAQTGSVGESVAPARRWVGRPPGWDRAGRRSGARCSAATTRPLGRRPVTPQDPGFRRGSRPIRSSLASTSGVTRPGVARLAPILVGGIGVACEVPGRRPRIVGPQSARACVSVRDREAMSNSGGTSPRDTQFLRSLRARPERFGHLEADWCSPTIAVRDLVDRPARRDAPLPGRGSRTSRTTRTTTRRLWERRGSRARGSIVEEEDAGERRADAFGARAASIRRPGRGERSIRRSGRIARS